MKHRRKKMPTFGRETDQRRALMRSLAQSFILHESLHTTLARAKALRPFIEPLITRARTDTLANRRLITARLGNRREVVTKLFKTIAPRYKSRAGGYTRVVKIAPRAGTGRVEAVIAFV